MVVNDWNPWKVKEIKPSNLILDKFESWEKSVNPRQKAWNRATKWLSDIIQLPCEETAGNKLRSIDRDNALKFLTNSIYLDTSFDNFLRSCMLPPTSSQESSEDDSASAPSSSNGSTSAKITPPHSAAKSGQVEKKGKICKFTWKGKECPLSDCKYVHKDLCEDRECLALLGGLPVWRSRNCQRWHIRPKSDKQKRSSKNGSTTMKSTENGRSNAGPRKNQVQENRNPKNGNPRNNNGPTSFRSSNHYSTAPLQFAAGAGHPKNWSYSALAKQGLVGNGKAAFANKPQIRGGNPNQRWGQQENQRLSQQMIQQIMKKSSEAVLQELKRIKLI